MSNAYINLAGLERYRPTPMKHHYLGNFGVSCPTHGKIASGLDTFDELALVFGQHALYFHADADWDMKLDMMWDDIPVTDDYAI